MGQPVVIHQLSKVFISSLLLAAALGLALPSGFAAEDPEVPTSGLSGPDIINWLPMAAWFVDDISGTIEQSQFLGPIIGTQETGEMPYVTVRPLFIHYHNEENELWRLHIVPPIFNYFKQGDSVRWDIYQLIRYRKLTFTQDIHPVTNFQIFPIYFSHETGHEATSYWGLFPIYGELQNFIGIPKINWVLFPLYAQFDRGRGETRYAAPWPIIRWQTGPISSGFAFWPLYSQFERENVYHRTSVLWPIYYRNVDNPHVEEPYLRTGVLPFYALEEGPGVLDETFLFPFFGYRTEFEPRPQYDETRYFWPFFVQGRGVNREINRWAPFYTYSRTNTWEKRWLMWPFFKHRTREEKGLLIDQQQVLFFVLWRNHQTSLSNPNLPAATMTHLWPFYSELDNGAGLYQFQLFSPLEVFFPHNQTFRDLYSPLFAIYRLERSPEGQVNRSFLWNLITARTSDTAQKVSIGPLVNWQEDEESYEVNVLHGLFSIGRNDEGERTLRMFWFDL